MSLETFLTELVTVKAQTRAKDASGGATLSPYSDLYTSVPARVNELDASQRMQYGMLQIHASHVVYTKQTGIENGHGIEDASGRFFRVTGTPRFRAMGSLPTFFKILVEEVKPI